MSRGDLITARVWVVVSTTARRALAERAPEAAGSIGFFAIFSFFPLLLILVAVSSALLANLQTQEQVLNFVLRFLPVSRELVSANMLGVLRARGAVGAIGLAGLLWSATSAFTALERNLNRAWPSAPTRGLIRSRLVALSLVGSLTGMAVLFLAVKAVAPVAGNWTWLANLTAGFEGALRFPFRAAIVGLMFCASILLYRLVPAVRVAWRDAAVGAAAATAAFAVATTAFTRFLESGLASYNLVYGSLGALVALLVWIYLVALIVLVGGHLCASLKAEREG
ncbi:MAG: YihY/virulence factor BrkB family protein [Candidatus Eisenbacteria bacterium]